MPQWLGGPEIVVLVLVLVIVFGWKKLPDAARSLGRSMRIFKSEVDELKSDGTSRSAASRDTVDGEAVRHESTTRTTDADGVHHETHTTRETHVATDRAPDVQDARPGDAGGSTAAPRA